MLHLGKDWDDLKQRGLDSMDEGNFRAFRGRPYNGRSSTGFHQKDPTRALMLTGWSGISQQMILVATYPTVVAKTRVIRNLNARTGNGGRTGRKKKSKKAATRGEKCCESPDPSGRGALLT